VVAGSSEGDVIALDAADGKERWRVRVGGEVLASPAVSDTVVVVRTVDGRLHGLSTADGRELWVNEQNVPRLTLRGTARPVIVGDAVLCGFDNGKVVSVLLSDGAVLWESQVAPSRGRTELERLVDIDSAVHVIGNDVFVVGFQGRAAMLALESGQIWWARDISSERGMAIGPEHLFISAADGDVQALRRRDGAPAWEQTSLHRRGLSGPALDGPTLVVADFQGYVHWLDAATGEVLARVKTDGDRVSNPPLVVDDKVFVQTDGGQISAFRRVATN
jgi:outer membrane protein assembly factor BamB